MAEFDFAALLHVCADWPHSQVSSDVASDPLMERLRQVLRGMAAGSRQSSIVEFAALLRQVLLRREVHVDGHEWIKVPLMATSWPTTEEWRASSFEVLASHSGLRLRAVMPRLEFLSKQADLLDDVFTGVPMRPHIRVPADPFFCDALGLPQYTAAGQREAVRALLHLPPGYTLIANLPTGTGKSVLAQLPPLLARDGSLTLVIVPTVALAIDQAARMQDLLPTPVAGESRPPLAYHGGLGEEERSAVWRAVSSGRQPVLFTSPEHATGGLRDLLHRVAAQGRLSHLVVDEAHLVTGWGNGFRPAFQLLPALVATMRQAAGERALRVVLASATLTASTVTALRRLFGPADKTYVVSGVHLRPEPRYASARFSDEAQREACVLKALHLVPRPWILYVTRPDEARRWAVRLREDGFDRFQVFTGKTASSERERLLRMWKDNELDGMVATSAFGLGVDKHDVRSIVHATLPESLDRFYQEVGRAGRDGKASASLLLFTDADVEQAESMSTSKTITDERGFERWSLMIDRARSDEVRPDVYWLDVRLLPPHLKQRSEESRDWNIRTLTLMARSRMVELVALTDERNDRGGERSVDDMEDVAFAAVRLLHHGHRREDSFAAAISVGREEVRKASAEGMMALKSVAFGKVEISQALHQTYSMTRPVWCPVVRCCGGCPTHWGAARDTRLHAAPVVPRLRHFKQMEAGRLRLHEFPLAGDKLLVLAVASATFNADTIDLLRCLMQLAQFHTLAFGPGCSGTLQEAALLTATDEVRKQLFVDQLSQDGFDAFVAGEGECRITVWPGGAPPLHDLWASDARLEVLVVCDTVGDPSHPHRGLLDTTPHVRAAAFLDRFDV